MTDFSLLLFSVYLPPENSPWGRDATAFYSHLLSGIYSSEDINGLLICGDVNGRIVFCFVFYLFFFFCCCFCFVSLLLFFDDIVVFLEEVKKTCAIDLVVNQHGRV